MGTERNRDGTGQAGVAGSPIKRGRERPRKEESALAQIFPRPLTPVNHVTPVKPSGTERELIKAMRRLQVATKDFGPEGIELFKVATLQYVQKQLRELQDVLSWVQGGPQPLQHVPPSGTLHPAPTAPAIRQLTPAEADAIALKAQAQVAQAPEKACQFCGQPSVYVSRRGVPHCIRHKAQGQADDQDELLSNKMRNQAFGEVIYVNPGNSGGE